MATKRKEGRKGRDGEVIETTDKPVSVLELQAGEDREDAKLRHASTGMKKAAECIKQMQKAVAHGMSTDDQKMALAVLDELASLASELSAACRQTVIKVAKENRNLQQ